MGITFRLLSHLTTLLGVEAVNDCIDLRSARLECVVWKAYLSLDALAAHSVAPERKVSNANGWARRETLMANAATDPEA